MTHVARNTVMLHSIPPPRTFTFLRSDGENLQVQVQVRVAHRAARQSRRLT